jgi:integrase
MQEYLTIKTTHTQQTQGRCLRWLRKELGALPLASLTPPFLRAWKAQLLGRVSPGTVRFYMYTLSAALTAAVDDYEWLARHPMRQVKLPPESPGRDRPLTQEELPRLLAACQQSRNPALYPLVLLALTTGRRKNELRCLRREQLDIGQGVIRLRTSKNKQPQVVAVVGLAFEVLQTWYVGLGGESLWIFPGRSGTGPCTIDDAWRQARDRAGLHDVRFHDLRHTCGTYLAMSGASLADIKEVLGHKHIKVTMKYIHLTLPHTRGTVERMARQFLRPPEPPPEV